MRSCPYCGAGTAGARISYREIAANIVCVAVLISVLMIVAWSTEHWIERESQHFLERMAPWREPIEL